MPRKITTLEGLQAELWKLVGDHGSVAVGLDRVNYRRRGSVSTHDYWSGRVRIDDADGAQVIDAVTVHGDTPDDVLLKIKAGIKDALAEKARHRTPSAAAQRTQAAGIPPARLNSPRRKRRHGDDG